MPLFQSMYEVRMIHRINDWNASVQYLAPDARTARKWAAAKMAYPNDWLIVSARRMIKRPRSQAA